MTGPAAAEGRDELPVAKDIRIRAQDDALLVDYQFARGYDADDVRITRSGRLLRENFPDARLRGKKRWPRARALGPRARAAWWRRASGSRANCSRAWGSL